MLNKKTLEIKKKLRNPKDVVRNPIIRVIEETFDLLEK
jgi:hypothetical protein